MSVADTQDQAPNAGPAPKPRRWRRRIKIAAITVIVLALVVRIVMIFALPAVISRVGGFYGLDIKSDRQSLAIVGGQAALWNVKIYPKGSGDLLFAADYVHGEILPWKLLAGKLHVLRAEADGVNLIVLRTSDGRIPLLEQLASRHASTPAQSTTPSQIDFTSPLIVEALRFTKVRAQIVDDAVTPRLDTSFTMDLRVSHLGAPQGTPVNFEIDAYAERVLDSLRIEGTATASGKNLDANARLIMRGLHGKPLAGYLQPLGLKPVADSIAMEANATLKARPLPAPSQAVAASCSIDHVHVLADDQEFATLPLVHIDADRVDATGVQISNIEIEGGRFAGERDARGATHIAGFELIPSTTTSATSTAWLRYPLGLTQVRLRDLQATFEDNLFSPPAQLKAIVNDFSVKPRSHGDASDITADLSLPGVARSVLIDGAIQPSPTTQSAELAVKVEGIHPEALQSYLESLGIESELTDAQFSGAVHVDFAPTTNIKLTGIRLADKTEFLSMGQIDLRGVGVDGNRLHIASADITGPAISATRQRDGSVSVLGMRIHPNAPAKSVSSPTTQPATLALPRVALGRLTWSGVKLTYVDRATPGATDLVIDDAGVEINDLVFDLTAKAIDEKAGTIHAWLNSPQLVSGGLDIEGTLTPGPQTLAADLNIRAEHLKLTPLAPQLKSLGIEPLLSDGQLIATAKLGMIAGFDGSVTSWVDLRDVSLRDTSDELLALDSLKVDLMTLKRGEFEIGEVTIVNPRGRAAREADGAIVAAGMRIRRAPSSGAGGTESTPMVLALKQFTLQNAQLHWSDLAVHPTVNTTAFVSASVSDLVLGRHASPAQFTLKLGCEGIVDELKIDCEQFDPTPGAGLVKMNITGSGIRGGPLDGYLPPGMKTAFTDGRIHATVLASRLQGVPSAFVDLINVDWRDGESKRLLSLDLARIAASNLDFNGNSVSVEEIALKGLETNLTIDAWGQPQFAGFAFSQGASAPLLVKQPENAGENAILAADNQKPLPLMVLNRLDLNVRKFIYRDERSGNATPITVSDLRLQNLAPITMGGEFVENQPPAQFELAGTVDPIAREVKLSMDAAPLAPEPVAHFDLSVTGIRGAGITSAFPELAKKLDGSAMKDGRFHAAATVHAKLPRRGAREFDLAHGFDGDLMLKDVTFRDRAIGRILAGAEKVSADSVHVDPKQQKVLIKTLEITKPIGYVMRDVQGIHALGFVYNPLAPTTAPAQRSVASANSMASANSTATTNPATSSGVGEIRIDRVLVDGADLRIEDRAVEPPLIVPLNAMDVEVRDLSTTALHEDKPIRFSAIVNSAKVSLPARSTESAPATQESEQRELFSQFASSGSISLYPALHGYTKTSINGVDLAAFKGEAGAGGVDLSGGILDADVNARFRDEGSLDLQSKFVLTDLHLTEPEHGPIQRHFGLSAPLDVVIAALRDPDGGITIPLNVPVEKGKVSTGDVIGAASSAMGQVLATAAVSAGVKVVAGVGEALSGGPKQQSNDAVSVRVPFKPGDVSMSQPAQQSIEQLIQLLRKDKNAQATIHSALSPADQTLADERANPRPEDCRALAEKLRADRAKMSADRAALAAKATAELASASSQALNTLQQLRDLDRQISQTDDTMDNLYDMLRPGAANQAARRARAAGLKIAELRLNSVRDALLAANLPDATDRIRAASATDTSTQGDEGAVIVNVVQRKRQR